MKLTELYGLMIAKFPMRILNLNNTPTIQQKFTENNRNQHIFPSLKIFYFRCVFLSSRIQPKLNELTVAFCLPQE